MTPDQIKHMVDRFLGWQLPEDFNPDCGISFKRTHSEQSQWGPQKYEPVGTNLLSATQATEMVRYMVEGLPSQMKAVEINPCPKCGWGEARVGYRPPLSGETTYYERCARERSGLTGEYLHCSCRRCSYEWGQPVLPSNSQRRT